MCDHKNTLTNNTRKPRILSYILGFFYCHVLTGEKKLVILRLSFLK